MNIQIELNNESSIPLKILSFSGGEQHVQISEVKNRVTGVNIRASVRSANDLMSLLLVENALRQRYGEALKINLELPYLPYARQDRVCALGQAFSLEVMARLLEQMRLNQLVVWDCHSDIGLALTGASNISPATIIQTDSELAALLREESTVLICPDQGAVGRCRDIQETLNLAPFVQCRKHRNPSTGHIGHVEVISSDLAGKTVVITDDICDGGRTFIQLAQQLRQKQVEHIVLYVTHGIFSRGLAVFDGLIDQIVTTNSLPFPYNPKLRTINFKYAFGDLS